MLARIRASEFLAPFAWRPVLAGLEVEPRKSKPSLRSSASRVLVGVRLSPSIPAPEPEPQITPEPTQGLPAALFPRQALARWRGGLASFRFAYAAEGLADAELPKASAQCHELPQATLRAYDMSMGQRQAR
jgi:hypothetical protein